MFPEENLPPSRAPYLIAAGVAVAAGLAWYALVYKPRAATPTVAVTPSQSVPPAGGPARAADTAKSVPSPTPARPDGAKIEGGNVTVVAPPNSSLRDQQLIAAFLADLRKRGTPLSNERAADVLGGMTFFHLANGADRRGAIDSIVSLASAVLDQAAQDLLREHLVRDAATP
ncbi:MAG: hypothetical protein RLZZ15_2932 [Verrucomicrobiota bacterium]|jgi:hypothetical protein